jgi:membrane protease YdiL (CAAX protease family)
MANATTPSPTSTNSAPPGVLALVAGPALVTLAITLLRVTLEVKGGPAWLASKEAGGHFALLGISWLPIVFGPWFALRIGRAVDGWKARLGRLAAALVVYGYLARIPVFVLFFVDSHYGWHTHYSAFPEKWGPLPWSEQVQKIAVAQLGFWPLGWTLVVGTIAGVLTFAIAKPTAPRPAPAR